MTCEAHRSSIGYRPVGGFDYRASLCDASLPTVYDNLAPGLHMLMKRSNEGYGLVHAVRPGHVNDGQTQQLQPCSLHTYHVVPHTQGLHSEIDVSK